MGLFSLPTKESLVGTLFLALILSYGALTAFFYFFQKSLIYFPTRPYFFTPDRVGVDYETVRFSTKDQKSLIGWFVPGDENSTVVLFFHGNAGNISDRVDTLKLWNQQGVTGFFIDYRGYGKSEGSPDEEGTYLDAQAAWDFLLTKKGFRPENIIIHGRSLGGPIAAWLASKNQAAGLILESTFISLPELGQSLYPFLPVKLLARVQYPTLQYLLKSECPVLVVHSKDDEIVPVTHGRTLAEECGERCQYLEIGGSHNEGFLQSRRNYIPGLKGFLSSLSNPSQMNQKNP